jgi:hypothetical protein
MEAASKGVKDIFSAITNENPAIALLTFSRQVHEDHIGNIDLFIFGIRLFFCLPEAEEFRRDKELVEFVRAEWIKQNDDAYDDWLSSTDDAHHSLKWEKWTFQAKNAILDEYLGVPAHPDPSTKTSK